MKEYITAFIIALAIYLFLGGTIIGLETSKLYYADAICVREYGTGAIYNGGECFLPSKK